jgi:undecaprenyl-diphosphatase
VTVLDKWIAGRVADHTREPAEAFSQVLTWGGDEHVICAALAAFWVYSQYTRRHERVATHLVAVCIASAGIPHVLKRAFNQRRPDRMTLFGHLRGIPLSGRADDAFPSGHAVHIGPLMSAASQLPPKTRRLIWA